MSDIWVKLEKDTEHEEANDYTLPREKHDGMMPKMIPANNGPHLTAGLLGFGRGKSLHDQS